MLIVEFKPNQSDPKENRKRQIAESRRSCRLLNRRERRGVRRVRGERSRHERHEGNTKVGGRDRGPILPDEGAKIHCQIQQVHAGSTVWKRLDRKDREELRKGNKDTLGT